MTTESSASAEEVVVEEPAPDLQEADPVATLTSDLQRLQAEYANYRKRIERDRMVAHEMAIAAVLTQLLALLDDVDRAEAHGELSGGFKAVADQLNAITTRIGLEKFGTEGAVFDHRFMKRSCMRARPMLQLQLRHRSFNQDINTKSGSCVQPEYQ